MWSCDCVKVSALKENMGFGISSNIAPLQTDVKEQKAGTQDTKTHATPKNKHLGNLHIY